VRPLKWYDKGMAYLPRRAWLLIGTAALFAGGALGVACSTPNPNGGDGGPDSGGDSTTGTDGGKDGSQTEGGGSDGGLTSCEAGISGSCDIVAQNCGAGKECAAVQTDAGFVLSCVTNTTGSIPEGAACTPSKTGNVCVAGLECISGRCAKHCCLGNDSACGLSQPEHFPGRCNIDVSLVNNGPGVYSVCSYSQGCEPFKIQACAAGQACYVNDSQGTATCTTIDTADAGEGMGCKYNNDCNKDGMGCYGAPDGGGFTCQWNCYNKGQGGIYDTQIAADAGAGYGGCPSGESCKLINWSGALPTWFGLCTKP
jgi:hypothetical protein